MWVLAVGGGPEGCSSPALSPAIAWPRCLETGPCTFKRKVDAERHLVAVEHAKLTSAYVDPAAGRVTFEAYAEDWRARQVHRPTTAAQVETNLRRHAYPALGHRALQAVRPSEVQTLVKDLGEHLAPATVELVYRYIAAVFRCAVTDRLIAVSPCTGIKLPAKVRRLVEPLTTEQVVVLVGAVPPRYQALVLTAAGTGLRQGECFGLTVDRVDFLGRQLTVDRQLVLMPGSAPELAPPKTDASYRTVPLPTFVVDALGAHLARYPAAGQGFIFTNSAGGPIRRTRFSDVWRPAVARAGLPVGTRFHDLRHYYASLLIRHSESVKTVQTRLGHASASETLDVYSHLWPDSDDRTRHAIETELGSAVSDLRHEAASGA